MSRFPVRPSVSEFIPSSARIVDATPDRLGDLSARACVTPSTYPSAHSTCRGSRGRDFYPRKGRIEEALFLFARGVFGVAMAVFGFSLFPG